MCLLCDLKSAQASASLPLPSHAWSSRRAFVLASAAAAAGAALPAVAQVDVGKSSSLRKLVPADQLEAAASQQYVQVMQEAQGKQVLLPSSHPQV
ncbi:MAG TPA: M48 family peptidase, partial [Hydrogenophaga sp.]|nr:M48 family peptidase [Hydrogenophaga sp.]